jgi:protein TonB
MKGFDPRWGAAMFVALVLSACGGDEPATESPGRAPADAAAQPAGAATDGATVPIVVSVETAEAALRDQRLFAPAGDNAFELFILALEAQPDSVKARDALTDLFPYAVLHVEQRTVARDAEDARRVMDLMARAQPNAPALERLERELERLERRLASEQQVPPARVPPPIAPTTAAPPDPVVAAPAPAPVETVVAPPEPTPTPAPVATPPPVAAPPPPVAASPAAPTAPRMIRQPNLRYPEDAARQGLTGSVTLDFQIDADGGVSDVRVVSSNPPRIFDREAQQAMRRSRFEPPSQPMRVRRTIDFNLD